MAFKVIYDPASSSPSCLMSCNPSTLSKSVAHQKCLPSPEFALPSQAFLPPHMLSCVLAPLIIRQILKESAQVSTPSGKVSLNNFSVSCPNFLVCACTHIHFLFNQFTDVLSQQFRHISLLTAWYTADTQQM